MADTGEQPAMSQSSIFLPEAGEVDWYPAFGRLMNRDISISVLFPPRGLAKIGPCVHANVFYPYPRFVHVCSGNCLIFSKLHPSSSERSKTSQRETDEQFFVKIERNFYPSVDTFFPLEFEMRSREIVTGKKERGGGRNGKKEGTRRGSIRKRTVTRRYS